MHYLFVLKIEIFCRRKYGTLMFCTNHQYIFNLKLHTKFSSQEYFNSREPYWTVF